MKMNKSQKALTLSLELSKKLLSSLEDISMCCSLDSSSEFLLNQDIGTIRELVFMIEKTQTNKQVREIWNFYRDTIKNFGEYLGGTNRIILCGLEEALWQSILELLSQSQDW
jgi:hypothetical protein